MCTAGVASSVVHGGTIRVIGRSALYVPAFCSLRSVAEPYRAPARRIPAEPSDVFAKGVFTATPAKMGVSYAYDLASTLYNDAEQRPSLVKQGLTRAGIEKV